MRELLLQLSREARVGMKLEITINSTSNGDIYELKLIDIVARKYVGLNLTSELIKDSDTFTLDQLLKEKITDMIYRLNQITP